MTVRSHYFMLRKWQIAKNTWLQRKTKVERIVEETMDRVFLPQKRSQALSSREKYRKFFEKKGKM